VSALPSLVFLSFNSRNDKRLAGWASFRESIKAGAPLGEAGAPASRSAEGRTPQRRTPPRRTGERSVVEHSSVGIWRLLASNNRELARGWSVYPSLDAACDDVTRLQRSIDSLVIAAVRGETASQNGWLATLDGEPVLSCGRWFGASSTSLHSARTAIAELALASFAAPAPIVAPAPIAPTAPIVVAAPARTLSEVGSW
jgi:hypothetical protein